MRWSCNNDYDVDTKQLKEKVLDRLLFSDYLFGIPGSRTAGIGSKVVNLRKSPETRGITERKPSLFMTFKQPPTFAVPSGRPADCSMIRSTGSIFTYSNFPSDRIDFSPDDFSHNFRRLLETWTWSNSGKEDCMFEYCYYADK